MTKHYLLPGVVVAKDSYPELQSFLDAVPEEGMEFIMTVAEVGTLDEQPSLDDEDEEVWRIRARVEPDVEVDADPERERYIALSQAYYLFLERKVSDCVSRFAGS